MPTYENPVDDAAEADEALRGLAYATRSWDDPADTYRVTGEIVSSVRQLSQVMDQMAAVHLRHQARVTTDDGDYAAGAHAAIAAADGFQQASRLLDQVDDRLAAAFIQSGRIVWHPELREPETAPQRWVSLVFLQGSEADPVLDLIDDEGIAAAVTYLASWDYGDETVEEAIANGHVYDELPAGVLDKTATHDVYTMTYNPHIGYVGLYRHPDALPDPGVLGIDNPTPEPEQPSRSGPRHARPDPAEAVRDASWFSPHPGPGVTPGGLGL